jgi:TPR repeat protein
MYLSLEAISGTFIYRSGSDGFFIRHGWGCTPDPAQAVKYLSAAASNAASIEELALQAGLKKGGSAKGELVLAIFELANCFRHGWGVPVDKVAAKQVRSTRDNENDWSAEKPEQID